MACSNPKQGDSKLLVYKDGSTEELKLSLTNDGANYFEEIPNDYEIVPVAVVGQGRTGKSSLMNMFIGKSVFETGSTTERVTKGIWVYIDLKHDTKKAIVYFDVEGFGDASKTDVDEYDEKLLAVVCQVCDVILYNTRDVYEKDMMVKIIFICSLFNRYREHNKVLSKPIFALVFRDFPLDFPQSPDTELRQQLEACEGGATVFQTFREVKSFPLVTPVSGRVKNLHEIPAEKLNDEFKTYYNLLKALVENQAQPLRGSMHIPGGVFNEVIKLTVKAVNEDGLHAIFQTFPQAFAAENKKIKERVKLTYAERLLITWPKTDEEETLTQVEQKCSAGKMQLKKY